MSDRRPPLDYALAYARSDWPVLPLHAPADGAPCDCGRPDCSSPGKHPRTEHGLKDASTDPEIIRAWWATWPAANVGIRTGGAARLVVLDVDGPEGEESLRKLLEGRELPATKTARTGGGGRHLLFRAPAGVEIGNAVRLLGLEGLDVRGEGGYIVAAPSRHVSGGLYEWLRGDDGNYPPRAELPAWLVDLLVKPERPAAPAEAPMPAPSAGSTRYGLAALEAEAAEVRATPEGARNHRFNAACFAAGQLVSGGELDAGTAEAALIAAALAAGLPEREARSTFRSGFEAGLREPRSAPPREERPAPEEPAAAPVPPDDGKRPVIRSGPDLPRVVDELEAALAADPGTRLFTRAGLLVRVVEHGPREGKRPGAIRRPRGLPIIAPAGVDWLTERAAAGAEWHRLNNRGEWVAALPMAQAIRSFMDRGEWCFPPLEAVAEHPVLRPDGSVLQAPGYDAASGVLLRPAIDFPPVPERPSADEVKAALDVLREPFAEFAFVADSDGAAALAIPLSLVARPAIAGPVPLFGISAPSPGEGKGLLAQIATAAAGGRPASVMAWSDDRQEQGKMILAACLEALPAIMLDNIEGRLGSPLLSMILTATEYRGRVLGANRTSSAPHRALWLATGNNLAYKGDTFRRVVPVHLDGRTERPEDRTFKIPDLRAWIAANRARTCAAALTVLRAYHVGGRPAHGRPRIGSFEAWDDLVRGALCWALDADPAAGRERIRREADPDLELMAALFSTWHEVFRDEWQTVRGVIDSTAPSLYGNDPDTREPAARGLRDLLAGIGKGDEERPDARAIGNHLRTWEGRIAGGLRLERDKIRQSAGMRWRVVSATPSAACIGASSVSVPSAEPLSRARAHAREDSLDGGDIHGMHGYMGDGEPAGASAPDGGNAND